MKGYKAILEQHALHKTPQLQKLRQTKRQFDKFISNFVYLEKQINNNVKNINTCLHQVQQKAANILYNLTQQINHFTTKRKSNYINMIQCGCGFETQSGEVYVEHLKNIHQSLKYVKGSTHFATFLGNVLKCDSFILQNIQGSKTKPKRKETPTPIKQDKFTKVKNRAIQNKSKDIVEKAEKIVKPPEVKETPKNNNNFMCGQCLKQFEGYKFYSFHMRSHDYIIHPNSSHIIIRKKKGTQFIYLNVHDDSYKNKKFSCPCNTSSNFSKDQFVAHAFKWHKGIVPVK